MSETKALTMNKMDNVLDTVLKELGEFGKYQTFVFVLVCVGVVFHSIVHVAFVFTAMDVRYRCSVPECESNITQYKQPWLSYALPKNKDGSYQRCEKYPYQETSNGQNCSASNFNHDRIIRCDDYIFETKEITILQEYSLYCEENLWKLTFVGTVNNIGQFFGLLVSGFISDRFGRKVILIWGSVFCGFSGILRTFAPNFGWFLTVEFLDAFFGSSIYQAGFIIAIELVGPSNRVISGFIAMCCFPFGEIIAALVAWGIKSWKPFSYIVYTPMTLLIVYVWIIPDSIRWYLSKCKLRKAKQTLRKIAKINKKILSEETLNSLDKVVENNAKEEDRSIKDVMKSRVLFLRFLNCCFSWMSCAFLFYGLTLTSVTLSDNSYLDFILSSVVEIPAYLSCIYLVNKLGRRFWQAASCFITAVSCLACAFTPGDMQWLRLCLFLIGKFGSTAAFSTIYVITSELFPTSFRHSVIGLCATLSRIGSMVAPQMPLLAKIWTPLPLVIFSAMGIVSGFLTLLFPETVGVKLPDTIEEAESIGKKIKNFS